jgi:nuclear protein localization family protein 4
VEEAAFKLGLRKVGWMFTDLVPAAGGQVTPGALPPPSLRPQVRHYRGMDTHFLSAQEIITASHYQNLYPNRCRQTDEGVFGSKFVTVCITGSKENQIDMQGYQVSNQCMALVRDKILVPTKDAPELAYIVESSEAQYVPDVFFMEKDKYGNEIKKVGRPLPVEYLLIDVPVSTPIEPLATFAIVPEGKKAFPVENRLLESSIQDFSAFTRYITQFKEGDFFTFVADLHVLIFMANLDIVPLRYIFRIVVMC